VSFNYSKCADDEALGSAVPKRDLAEHLPYTRHFVPGYFRPSRGRDGIAPGEEMKTRRQADFSREGPEEL
jgi:hypothetical protein